MPTRHGIEVSIIEPGGKPFVEYGERNLSPRGAICKKVTTKIESKTNQVFYIRVRPDSPFQFNANERSDNAPFMDDPLSSSFDATFKRTRAAQKTLNEQPMSQTEYEKMKKAANTLFLPSRKPRPIPLKYGEKTPPFKLAVFVYIDGRDLPECRHVIPLDPEDPNFKKDGYTLEGRWVSDKVKRKDGTPMVRNYHWSFAEVGVDILLSRMAVTGGPAAADPDPEIEDLSEMMTESTLAKLPKNKVGEIMVKIARIYTGGFNFVSRPDLYLDAPTETRTTNPGTDITHAVSTQCTDGAFFSLLRPEWRYFKRFETEWAVFVFQYMSREKLKRIGLLEDTGAPSLAARIDTAEEGPKTNKRLLEEDVRSLIPLARPLTRAKKTKTDLKDAGEEPDIE